MSTPINLTLLRERELLERKAKLNAALHAISEGVGFIVVCALGFMIVWMLLAAGAMQGGAQ